MYATEKVWVPFHGSVLGLLFHLSMIHWAIVELNYILKNKYTPRYVDNMDEKS